MKKIINVLLILAFVVPILFHPIDVSAKTVRDLVNELNELERAKREADEKVRLTESEINSAHSDISSISRAIDKAHANMIETEREIEQLNEDIQSKDKEIKEIMNFLQLSNGESAYLEYAFGAQDFTDFIYRMAISEQLANHNSNLIDEFNHLITKSEEKIESLEKKVIELDDKQDQLRGQVVKLGEQLSELEEVGLSVDDEIKAQQQLVRHYRDNLKCELDEPIATCGRRLPPGTAFYRPVVQGTITSNYGMRTHPTRGTRSMHGGVDIGTYWSSNVPIYATAPGRVENIIYRTNCGGTMVFLNHVVNGRNYTSVYMHLYRVNVSMGDIVSHNTQIGVMGGDRGLTPWDYCTTGLHLHFEISRGHHGNLTAGHISSRVNPRDLVNFPAGVRTWFNGRNIRY